MSGHPKNKVTSISRVLVIQSIDLDCLLCIFRPAALSPFFYQQIYPAVITQPRMITDLSSLAIDINHMYTNLQRNIISEALSHSNIIPLDQA